MKKVAIVGFGFMGKTHYGVWRKLKGARVVAICDSNLAQLSAKVVVQDVKTDNSRLPKSIRIYDDFDRMIDAGGFDIVDITLPTPLHPQMTEKALAAGYHVLCEKPMAVDVKSCDRMLAAERQAKGRFLVAQCVRFNPQYSILKNYVESGRFGKVIAADFTRFCPLPGWGKKGASWFLDESKSGGAAIDMHVHDADFIQYLFGLPPAVSTRTHVTADGLTDHLSTSYLYPDKVVTADTSWAAAPSLVFDAAYRVFFERATVYCGDRYKQTLVVYPQTGKPFCPKIAKCSSYEVEIPYFLGLVEGRKPKRTVLTATDARNSIALVMAEKKSAKTGRPVRVHV